MIGYKLREEFLNGDKDLKEYYEVLFDRIEELEDLNIFISYDEEKVKKRLDEIEQKDEKGALYGIPFTLKDNISMKGMGLTCGSKMLKDFEAVYDATVTKRILDEDGVILGKVNMDEFAMGSSSETSYFGVTKNPLDPERIPGGSSAGSCAAVASGIGAISLGTDTGGSTRQPASYCNVMGYMPSYGTFSRYGVVSMANTLDQVGIVANTVKDIVLTANIIGGQDEKDMVTTEQEKLDFTDEALDISGVKIGILSLDEFDIEEEVRKDYDLALEQLKAMGAELIALDFKYLKYALPLYNVIMSAEVSSNMSRFDGIRYGFQAEDYEDTRDLYVKTRSQGFGEEVKRRIAMGTHYLSSSDDQLIYKQGLKVRRLLAEEFYEKYEEVDFIATPTVTNLPCKIGERIEDPLAMYDSGSFNVPVNLAGLCAISMPVRKGLSSSIQFIGNRYGDKQLLQMAAAWEGRK
ncbi:MAG: Asp-tRNA(Asn)/Glu-tRNA(Gln) amidotransferase subunit GatA [Tissierellia bacterium]|nr:Asp-tRNA(Asn)/Glu-tRNA(Gln) amidotransferase subunit GatA [Tissierellia bacterium]